MRTDYLFTSASERELNSLTAGEAPLSGVRWPFSGGGPLVRVGSGTQGVLWREASAPFEAAQPLALIVSSEDRQRLFGRFSQLRSDLSPLSAWCHLLAPSQFSVLEGPVRAVDLNGFEAAWAGLIVAEALLLSKRSVTQLKLPVCLATQTFSVARTAALWNRVSILEILDRYDSLQRLVRNSESGALRLRTALGPIWSVFLAASLKTPFSEQRSVVEAIHVLRNARLRKTDDEAIRIHDVLSNVLPEAAFLRQLSTATPEARLKEFDALVFAINGAENQPVRKSILGFLAGYLATVAAGGSSSLALAEDVAEHQPEVTAWAYAIGGVGEKVTWTSSFDGVGRLLTRELARPFRIDDPPTCDFALDEATILVDKQLSDPLVHLKVKQLRVATVSLYPGVNISTRIDEQPVSEVARGRRPEESASKTQQDLLELLVTALLPRIRERLAHPEMYTRSTTGTLSQRKTAKLRTGKKGTEETKLPLDE